jgi:hypothetical protein
MSDANHQDSEEGNGQGHCGEVKKWTGVTQKSWDNALKINGQYFHNFELGRPRKE